jgi:hypothetical protein
VIGLAKIKIKLLSPSTEATHWRTTLLFISLFLTFEYWFLGPYSYTSSADNMNSFISRYLLTSRDLLSGSFSYFYRYAASGIDTLANSFIPALLLLFSIFPYWASYQIAFFLQVFVSLIGTFLLCRDGLKLRTWCCFYAAVAFALFNTIRQENHIYAFLGGPAFPLLLWGGHKLFRSNHRILAIFLICFLAGLLYGLTSSLPITIPFALPLLLLWFYWICPEKNKLMLLAGFVAVVSGILIPNIPVLYAMKLNGSFSHRIDWTLQPPKTNLPFQQWLEDMSVMILNDYISSTLISVFIIAWLLKKRYLSRNQIVLFLKMLSFAVLTASSAAIFYLTYPHLSSLVPSLRGFDMGRFCLFSPFFWVISGTFALENLLLWAEDKNEPLKRRLTSFTKTGIIVLFIIVSLQTKFLHFKDWLANGNLKINYNIAQLIKLRKSSGTDPFRVATVVTGLRNGSFAPVVPGYIQAHGMETPDGLVNIYPLTYKRYWSSVISPLTKHSRKLDIYFNEWGNAVYLFAPEDIEDPEIIFSDYYDLEKLSLANVKYIVSRYPLQHQKLKLISQPSVPLLKWDNSGWKERIMFLLKENFYGREVYIYENLTAYPRFYFDSYHNEDLRGSIAVKKYSSDEVLIEAEHTDADTLIFANSYSPYWKAYVDRRPVETFKGRDTFIGITVSEGKHSIRFLYDPPYKIAGF